MSVKLLFITSHYFYQPTVDALARLDIPCETTVIPYEDYSHISEVYGMYADKYDACLTSGIVAMNAIRRLWLYSTIKVSLSSSVYGLFNVALISIIYSLVDISVCYPTAPSVPCVHSEPCCGYRIQYIIIIR